MARPLSTTTLEIGTLSIPVGIATATDSQKDPKLDRRSPAGNPLNRIEVDSDTREEVLAEDVLFGLDTADGFKEIPREGLEAIKEETKIDFMQVIDFVPIKVAQDYFTRVQGSYYLQPQAKFGSARPMRLLYEAMKKRKVVAVAKVVLRSRQSLAMVQASPIGALVMNTVVFDDAWRQPDDEQLSLQTATVEKRFVDAATDLIDAMTTDGASLRDARDDLIPLKQGLVDEAVATGKVKRKPKSQKTTTTVAADKLMEELAASVKQARGKGRVAA